MPTDAQKDFIENLIASQIVSAAEFKTWGRAELKDASDSESLANNLVQAGKLTPWQAKYLLGGRTRLRFGSYILTNRLGRDDLGDSFVGKHDKLDRNVRLLFLSTTHSKTLTANEQLIRELAATTDVDHPNLEQVHLIDQDTGRYMFVTQQLEGMSLSQSELLTQLSAAQIPAILKQIISGLSAAHEAGLSHGSLSEDNVYVSDMQQVKLEGFLRSNLRSNLIDSKSPTTADDIESLHLIAIKLVKRFDSQEAREILADLESVSRKQMQLTLVADKEYLKNPSLQAVDTSSPSPEKPARKSESAGNNRPTKEEAKSVQLSSNKARNLMWATAALLAVATLVILGPKLLGGKSDHAQARTDASQEPIELPSLQEVMKTESATESLTGTSSPPTDPVADVTSETDMEEDPVGINLETDPDDAQDEHLDIESIEDSDDGSKTPVHDAESKPDTDASSGSSFLDRFKASSEIENEKVGSGESSKPATINGSNETTDETKESAATKNAAPVATAPTTFPSAIDLPPNTISDGLGLVSFGDRSISALGLELLSDENVASRSKIQFELSGERNRSWDVSLIHSQGKTKVGRFAWENDQLNFNWLPEAAEVPDVNYLGNCILKINDGTGPKFLPLRKPIIIPGFVLQRDDPRLRVEIDNLRYLPKGVMAELHELDSEKYGQVYFGEAVEDQTFSKKQPLRLMFSEIPEYQLVMLTLNAEIKNKSKLEALLQVQLSQEQKPRLANDKTMESAKQFLEQYIVDVTNNYETLKKMKVDELRKQLNMTKEQLPYEDKKARENQLKEEIEIAKKRAEVFRETQSKLESFFSQPIPVSIYYQLGERRVVLATTVNPGR